MYVISACLTGECCKYNGKSNLNEELTAFLRESDADVFLVCPEQLGGLPTPRGRAEIEGGKSGEDVLKGQARVISETGEDLTEAFVEGARQIVRQIGRKNITGAILKSRSPSCGCGYIYDGSFTGKLISGNGVTSALLIQNGIKVVTEDQFSVFNKLEDSI